MVDNGILIIGHIIINRQKVIPKVKYILYKSKPDYKYFNSGFEAQSITLFSCIMKIYAIPLYSMRRSA